MNDLPSFFHAWGYVIVSYNLVFLCCIVSAIMATIRFKRSLSHLKTLEQSLESTAFNQLDEEIT